MSERDAERRDWITAQLKANDFDAFICSTPANVLMLTGYWPVIGKSIAIATKDGDAELIVPQDEQELASNHGANITTFSGSLLRVSSLRDDLARPLASALNNLGLNNARLGIDSGSLLIPAAYVSVHVFGRVLFSMLSESASNSKIVPADAALEYLRSRLTAREMDKLRTACEIAAMAYKQGREWIEMGATEAEVAAAFRKVLSVNVGYKGTQRVDGSVWCMSGPNSAHACAGFQRSTDRRLRAHDLVLMHCNSYADGYWTDITRTYNLGEADERSHKILGAISEARACAIAAVHPGVNAKDIDAVARDAMTVHGFGDAFRHGTGHGVGFAAIDHDAPPRLSPNSPDIIEVGMAFNIEPGAYIDGYGGARHCDMVLCTERGAELLTEF